MVSLYQQSKLYKQVSVKTILAGEGFEDSSFGSIAEAEVADCLVGDAAAVEVAESNVAAVVGVGEEVLELLHGPLVGHEHGLSL